MTDGGGGAAPFPAGDGLVVVVVEQVERLAGPGVGDEAYGHVGLAWQDG